MRCTISLSMLLLFVSIHALLTNAQTFEWYVEVLEYENYAPNNFGLAQNSTYLLNILVWNEDANQIDYGTTRELLEIGEIPTVFVQTYYTLPHSQTFTSTTITLENNGQGESIQGRNGWFVVLDTSIAAITSLGIKSSGIGLGNIYVQDTTIFLHTDPFLKREMDINSLPVYSNFLGVMSSNITTISPPISQINIPQNSKGTPVSIAIIFPYADYLIYSNDDFDSIHLVHPSYPTVDVVCPISQGNGIRNAYLDNNMVILNTEGGLVFGMWKNGVIGSEFVWSVVFKQCVDQIVVRSVRSTNYMFAFNAGFELYFSSFDESLITSPSFSPLIDSQGQNLAGFFSNSYFYKNTVPLDCVIISVDLSDIHSNRFLFLLDTASTATSLPGRYVLVQFDYVVKSWSTVMPFPRTLTYKYSPQPTPFVYDSILDQFLSVDFNDTSQPDFELQLFGMSFSKYQSTSLYIWGNTLFSSPDNGNAFFILYTPVNGNIQSFVPSADRDDYSFIVYENETNTQLWCSSGVISSLGKGSRENAVPVLSPRPYSIIENSMMSSIGNVFYDASGELGEIIVDTLTGEIKKTFNFGVSVANSLYQIVELFSFPSPYASISPQNVEETCPFQLLSLQLDLSPHFLRTLSPTDGQNSPLFIYLNMAESYTFNFTYITSSSQSLSTQIRPFVSSATTNLINIDIGENIYYLQNNFVFTITVTDLGNGIKDSPGNSLLPTPMTISVPSSCSVSPLTPTLNTNTDDTLSHVVLPIPSATPIPIQIVVHSGCSPAQTFFLNQASTVSPGQGCRGIWNNNPQVTCLYYGYNFIPVFNVSDGITGDNEIFQGLIKVEILGAGPTLDDIHIFDEDEFVRYNDGGSRPIWDSYNDQNGYISVQNQGQYIWLCGPNTPCYSPPPKIPNVPEYFFLLKATTVNSVDTTYCNFELTFLVRVHSFNLEIGEYIAVTIIMAVFCLSCIGLGFGLIMKYKPWLLYSDRDPILSRDN